MKLSEFQATCKFHTSTHTIEPIFYCLMGLVEEVGEVTSVFKRGSRMGHTMAPIAAMQRDKIRDECGDVLWYLSRLLTECGLTLEEAAQHNIDKMEGRRVAGIE